VVVDGIGEYSVPLPERGRLFATFVERLALQKTLKERCFALDEALHPTLVCLHARDSASTGRFVDIAAPWEPARQA
jgi:hypothetical protein